LSRSLRAFAAALAAAACLGLAAAPEPSPPAETADAAAARALFEKNLAAIRNRDRAAYLSCYLDAPVLARTGPSGPSLGFEALAAGTGDRWPDSFEASDLRLMPLRAGVVYGTYRYRVRYGAQEDSGISERLFLRIGPDWKIAVTSAFSAPAGTPPPPRALKGGTLLDGTGASPVANAVVLLRDGKIECAGADCQIPSGVAVTDVTGMWITPGLVDAHVHFSQTGWADGRPDSIDVRDRYPYDRVEADLKGNPERFFRSQLCSGVTSVFDVGGYPWTIAMAKREHDDSRAPRVAAAGPLLSTLDHWLNLPAERQFIHLKDPDAAGPGVRYLATQGADAVKVWYIVTAKLPVEASASSVLAAGEAARKSGLPLIVHATGLAEAKVALRAGAKLLVHSVDDLPVDDEFLALAKKSGTIYCPTLTVMDGYVRLEQAAVSKTAPAVDDPNGCVDPATLAHVSESASLTLPESADEFAAFRKRVETANAVSRANLKRVAEAGIPIAMGTDAGNPLTLHGPSVYAEMEAMQAAGLTPMQVLTASTRGGARAMGIERETGTIEKGKAADLLVVAADPTADVANFRKVRLVVRGGVARPIEELHATATALSPALQGDLAFGPWPVGFRTLSEKDPARKVSGGRPRPVPIAVWFPAQDPGPAPPMSYRDYVVESQFEYKPSPTPAERQAEANAATGLEPFDKLDRRDVERWFSEPMKARRGLAPAQGPFPLVLLAQGNGESIPDQSFLAEYLSSHGYVVASVPSPMLLTGDLKGVSEVAARAEDQARDMAFAWKTLSGSAGVTAGRVGLIGHSFGARSALLLAMNDPRVAAVVCLDGALATDANAALVRSRLFAAKKQTAPVLVFYETLAEAPDLALFRSLAGSDRWLVQASDIQHHHFSTLGAFLPLAPSLASATRAFESTRTVHDAVCRATLSFLDTFVKPGTAADWNPPVSSHFTAEKLSRQ
jgi:imidazolonepropionase-like amidohydrolase/dienelactone hydrolase